MTPTAGVAAGVVAATVARAIVAELTRRRRMRPREMVRPSASDRVGMLFAPEEAGP
ncbi:MAG: hypothetical protein ACK4WC_11920 [Rubrimonas sp.]